MLNIAAHKRDLYFKWKIEGFEHSFIRYNYFYLTMGGRATGFNLPRAPEKRLSSPVPRRCPPSPFANLDLPPPPRAYPAVTSIDLRTPPMGNI